MDIGLKRVADKRYVMGQSTGGNSVSRFALELNTEIEEDIYQVFRATALSEMEVQELLGNPVSQVLVDNNSYTPIWQARRIIRMKFGAQIDSNMIRTVERTLARNIRLTTNKDTGRLRDVRGNWQWFLYDIDGPGGKRSQGRPVNPYALESLKFSERLVLAPRNVVNESNENYASAANKRVAKKTTYRADRRYKAKDGPRPSVAVNKGFMGRTAEQLRRNGAFKRFYWVRAVHSKAFRLPGELRKKGGSVYLVIGAAVRG